MFSKLSLTLTLLVCLIGTLYILYTNYNKQNELTHNTFSIEQELQTSINKNSELIKSISIEINKTTQSLNEINKILEKITDKDKDGKNLELGKNINSINENIKILSKEIENIKNNKSSFSQNNTQDTPEIVNKSLNEIIDLILIKYANNISIHDEMIYLRKIINNNKIINYEKLTILSAETYKGHDYVNQIYNEEVNHYLKKIVNKNPESFFSKIILPYLNISPSSENEINDDLIIKIKEIKINIQNKNFENALKTMKNIDDYENIFLNSSEEITKYLSFKTELDKLR